MKNDEIEKAVRTLNKGGIVIFPTDTAFGIGCRIDKEDAVKKLFKLRKRPETQPAPVLAGSLEMAREYFLDIPESVITRLIKPYWPGALTIILPCRMEKIPELVRGGGKNIGIRIPNHKKILKIIEKVGVPILSPSANFHNAKTPFRFSDLDKDLVARVDFVVSGRCRLKQASTVIDCAEDEWKIIRYGAVNLKI